MKHEEINRTLENLKPAIEAIVDENVKTIINTLLTIIEALQKENQELKEKLNINSGNSSKPPSSDGPSVNKKKKKKDHRNRGGQPGHVGAGRILLPESEVDHIERHGPPSHCACGGDVQATLSYQRRQVHDLPVIKTVVTEHQLFYGYCQSCGKEHRAELPGHVPPGMLGPCLLALIATLSSDYKMSKRDVSRFLMDFCSLTISIATVKRAEETVSAALAAPVEEARVAVREQRVANCDETSHAECGKKMWAWVAIANTMAVFLIASSRSTKVAKALLGEAFAGILCSDRYSAYSWMAANRRQVCWSHLIRDFKKISQRPGKSKGIGLRLLVYSRRMFHYWHQVQQGTLTREQFAILMAPVREGVEALLLAGTGLNPETEDPKTRGTCLEILKVKAALWTFISHAGVDPTNNLAEQVLRKIVIWRKVCFGTWSETGTRYLERAMTVVATCRLQNRSVCGFLREAINAHFSGEKPPSLLPAPALTNYPDSEMKLAA